MEDDKLLLGEKRPLITGSETHTVFIKVLTSQAFDTLNSDPIPILETTSTHLRDHSFFGILCPQNVIWFYFEWPLFILKISSDFPTLSFLTPLWHFVSSEFDPVFALWRSLPPKQHARPDLHSQLLRPNHSSLQHISSWWDFGEKIFSILAFRRHF